jgi:hypothetical protein
MLIRESRIDEVGLMDAKEMEKGGYVPGEHKVIHDLDRKEESSLPDHSADIRPSESHPRELGEEARGCRK